MFPDCGGFPLKRIARDMDSSLRRRRYEAQSPRPRLRFQEEVASCCFLRTISAGFRPHENGTGLRVLGRFHARGEGVRTDYVSDTLSPPLFCRSTSRTASNRGPERWRSPAWLWVKRQRTIVCLKVPDTGPNRCGSLTSNLGCGVFWGTLHPAAAGPLSSRRTGCAFLLVGSHADLCDCSHQDDAASL